MARVVSALLGGAACGLSAPIRIAVDPADTFGSWESFGVSFAWWGNVYGGNGTGPMLADLVYSFDNVSWPPTPGLTLPGLALNLARYNAGASSNTSYDGSSISYSPNIPWWKEIQAFWVDWASDNPDSSSWDWTRDANQVNLLKLAAARGLDTIEVFSNSPVWWMCDNHNPSGAADGGDNMQAWNEANHSLYMATVAAHLRGPLGLPVTSVELFNEPSGGWWKAAGTQEGCDFAHATQARVLASLPGAMARVGGLDGVRVAASDESFVDQATATWAAFDDATRSIVDQVNVHGYQGGGGNRAALYDAVVRGSGKILHGSEFGDGDGSGGGLVASLTADWASLHPRSWSYWQILDPAGGWGLAAFDSNTFELKEVNTKYYAVAQFSRHIRPGMTILGGAADPRNATALALSAAGDLLVVVTSNPTPNAITVLVDVGAFAHTTPGAPVNQWLTSMASPTPTAGAAYTRVWGNTVSEALAVNVSLPPWGLVTLEVPVKA